MFTFKELWYHLEVHLPIYPCRELKITLKQVIVEFLFQSSVTVLILENAVLKYMEMCGTFSSI